MMFTARYNLLNYLFNAFIFSLFCSLLVYLKTLSTISFLVVLLVEL